MSNVDYDAYDEEEDSWVIYKLSEVALKLIPKKCLKELFKMAGNEEELEPEIGNVYGFIYHVLNFKIKVPIKRFIWKIQKAMFFGRYKTQCCFERIENSELIKRLTKVINHVESSFNKLASNLNLIKAPPTKEPCTGFSCCFPIEVWYLLVKDYNVNAGNLVRVNKELCNFFAPVVYKSIHMDITISPIDTLQTFYSHYCNFGSTYLFQPSSPFKMYKMLHDSQNFQYEFIDLIHTSSSNDNADNVSTRYIRNFRDVKNVFENIISNPNSLFKDFVKELTTSICFLDGFDKFTKEGSNFAGTIQSLSNKTKLNVLASDFNSFDTFELDENYEYYIRKGIDFDLEELDCLVNDFTVPRFPYVKETLPESEFYRELTLPGIVQDDFKKDSKYRSQIFNANSMKDLESSNPFQRWNEELQPDTWNYDRETKTQLKGAGSIKLQNRSFFSEVDTQNFLSNFVHSIASMNVKKTSKTSTLIFGSHDIENSYMDDTEEERDQNIPFSITPHMIIINGS
ncbi:hypothetical protein BN7_2366 [Wickerhamomyces ciferrii]|uniref:Uncharacterized protein n=1 Tax=Wickerhamomyces ciferrii (strain ATCC 14091 / BCRC 22168 / CBS 111 / JCM 3599 / NBRC 0793 / NRRL Y-1031 F-60-10) TaxID=1206466 RepID=K0KIL7_WICCF|nr:uncharacterized protein BN7_2366 [Wickerhamomyces ciferrii]CCH42821.1 hypothetical protein BN7_2366 [Wickerhamomyces ciferrii]